MKKYGFFIILLVMAFANSVFANANETYWSKDNAPIIYGATKITLKKGMLNEFKPNDARFRVFAKDFEDGDLTEKITYTGEVNTLEEGIYTITYSVVDSDGNVTNLDVEVIVNSANEKINVERTIYTIPSVWNQDLVGVKRNNYGDRQHLGIYLPAGSSVNARVIDSDYSLTVQFITNDAKKEISQVINKNGSWVTLKNVKNDISYSSVPLVTSPVLSKENTEINKVLKIELEYGLDVKELNYYHYKDNEETFLKKWISDNSDYGFVENEVLNMVVPIGDINKMTNYYNNCFSTLDNFLEYYQKVVDKMDEIIGLNLNPDNALDQNVRTKYLIRANANGVGAAYYSGNHVGINSASMASFFEMNWGGLHELAHGYQGSLGKGEMHLGEVGNNILGYYIQNNKDIYYYSGNWLGNLSDIEESKNAGRLQGKTYNEQDVSTKLYMIINLFNHFENEETYAKMFKWYRNEVYNNKVLTNQDAYVEAIADIYNVNIIPYMEAWNINISSETKNKVFEKKLPMVSILNDVASHAKVITILTNEEIEEKYSVVSNDLLEKYEVSGSLKLNINIDNIENLMGKDIEILDGKDVVKTIKITSNVVEIENITSGTYYLKMPVLYTYTQDYMYIQIKENMVNEYTYEYREKTVNDFDNYFILKLQGIYNTFGYELTFSDSYKLATIKLNGANMGTGNNPYVKIYDENMNIVSNEKVAGIYFDYNKESYSVELKENYTIKVYHPNKSKVQMISKITGNIVEEFKPTEDVTIYKVVENGIIKSDTMTKEDYDELSYQILREKLVNLINDYKEEVTEDELKDISSNFKKKEEIIDAYNSLALVDKKTYQEFVESLTEVAEEEVKEKEEVKTDEETKSEVEIKPDEVVPSEETKKEIGSEEVKEEVTTKTDKMIKKNVPKKAEVKETKPEEKVEDAIRDLEDVKIVEENDDYYDNIIRLSIACLSLVVAIIFLRKYMK